MAPLADLRIRWIIASAFLFSLAGLLFVDCSGRARDSVAELEKGFQNPPPGAKPRVWWHWMNGNITKEGIRADLDGYITKASFGYRGISEHCPGRRIFSYRYAGRTFA